MAISAKELRVGNLVKYSLSNIPQEIKSVINVHGEYLVNFQNSGFSNTIDKIKPIPLTEDWLLKFGLTNVTEELDTEKSFEIQFGRKTFRVVIDDRGLCTVIYQVDIGMNFQELTDVEFVHEFQNLIFALCGEELKLN